MGPLILYYIVSLVVLFDNCNSFYGGGRGAHLYPNTGLAITSRIQMEMILGLSNLILIFTIATWDLISYEKLLSGFRIELLLCITVYHLDSRVPVKGFTTPIKYFTFIFLTSIV